MHLVELTVQRLMKTLSRRHMSGRTIAIKPLLKNAGRFPIEVGCRGFFTSSLIKSMRVARLGLKKGKVLTKALQETVDKASHWIWLERTLPELSHEG